MTSRSNLPYGKDPQDSNIRMAPSYPTPEELAVAVELFVLCVNSWTRSSKKNKTVQKSPGFRAFVCLRKSEICYKLHFGDTC